MIQKCPDAGMLAAFSVGDLNDDEFLFLVEHLSSCSRCEQALTQLDSHHDPLVERIQIAGAAGTKDLSTAVSRCEQEVLDALENPVRCDVSFDAGKHYSRILKSGSCRLGRFELLEEVGVGSFGHVFRALDTELNRTVAVKIQRAGAVATDDEAKRFLREARSTASLKHPWIVSLFDTGQTEDGVCFLVTEFVEGQTLESKLRKESFSFHESAELLAQICDAMHYAHEQGVIHRDIKPSNILIDKEGLPHVADFGLAKRDTAETAMTSEGQVMGTPAYMSPEVARGDSNQADARSDIYGVGVMLYEMLTGEQPFQGTKRIVLLQVLENEPRHPRQLNEKIPRDLETICLKAMSKASSRRYATAGDFASDLRNFAAGEPIAARPVSRVEKFFRWCKKYPFAAALFIGITLSSAAGFAYLKYLNTWFVEEMALDHARLYSDMMDEFSQTYSDVRTDYMTHSDPANNPPPLPATMQIEVAERISCDNKMEVRIFSEHSFREELRPRDKFEINTLARFKEMIADPESRKTRPSPDPVWTVKPDKEKTEHFPFGEIDRSNQLEYFEFIEIDDRPYLKYARAQVMESSCVECHNEHSNTPKADWKEGDLAGVFSLTRPLDRDIRRARSGFQGASLLMLTIALFLTLCGIALAYQVKRKSIA